MSQSAPQTAEDAQATPSITPKRVGLFVALATLLVFLLTQVGTDTDRAFGMTAAQEAGDAIWSGVLEVAASSNPQLNEAGEVQMNFVWQGPESARPFVLETLEGIEFIEGGAYDVELPTLQLQVEQQGEFVLLRADILDQSVNASRRIGDWRSVVPPLLAILVALIFRKLLLAMLGGIGVGALLHFSNTPGTALFRGAKAYIWENVTSEFNLMILAFTFTLIGMVMVTTRAGGSQGLINVLGRLAASARSTRLATAIMGVVVFFDDYANAIVVGTTVRPMSDRQKVSREKLAYLVDSTAAPIAGLAIISTWIAFEVGILQTLIDQVNITVDGNPATGYGLFLGMLPFRLYCIVTLFFVFTGAATSRDYGPMLKAERRALETGQLSRPGAKPMTSKAIQDMAAEPGIPCRWYNAALPVIAVVGAVMIGMFWSGSEGAAATLAEQGKTLSIFSFESWKFTFGEADSAKVLLISSLLGSLLAIGMAAGQRLLPLRTAVKTWFKGVPAVSMAIAILICAWGIQSVCKDLGTNVFLVSAIGDTIPPVLFPLFAFIMAGGVAFATGTSWGTMGILLPVVLPWAWAMAQSPDVPFIVVLLSAAAVLDGAIMGDHCSPISDTTVMSSIATSCDHVDHVRTQMPYALTCMAVAAGGYVAMALEFPLWATYLGLLGLVIAVFFVVGRPIRRRTADSASD